MPRERSEQILIRLTPFEKELILDKMKSIKAKNYTDFFIRLVCTHRTINVDTEPLLKISWELNKIGVNLNQIAKAVSTSKELNEYSANSLYVIQSDIGKIQNTVDKTLSYVAKGKEILEKEEGEIDGLYKGDAN